MYRPALAAIASLTSIALLAGSALATDKAAPSKTMWFADEYATAYYQLEERTGGVIMTVEPGPKGGNAVESRRYLADGQAVALTITGTGNNAIAVKLTVWRHGKSLTPSVETEVLPAQQLTN